MKKLVYELTYADGFKRLTEVNANVPADALVKMFDAWSNMNIQANLVEIR